MFRIKSSDKMSADALSVVGLPWVAYGMRLLA